MPRKPLGDRPLTNAERQARHRAARAASRTITSQRPTDAAALSAGAMPSPNSSSCKSQYAQWFEALPENLQEGATGEALQAIVDLDLDELIAIVPPRGFGRD